MIHRLQRHGDRSYGKARTLCGFDVQGQIHPLAEVYTDGQGAETPNEPECQACARPFDGNKRFTHHTGERKTMTRPPITTTIHVLHHGFPLCGYGEGETPNEWPADQAWLPITDIGRHDTGRGQWCQPCLEKAREGGLPAAAAGTNALDHMRTRTDLPAAVVTVCHCGHQWSGVYGSKVTCPCGRKITIGEEAPKSYGEPTMRGAKNPDDGMRRFEVWSLRTIGNGGVDVRVGRAIENRDKSISLELPELGVRLKLKLI